MEELFALRREHRKLSNRLEEGGAPGDVDSGGERYAGGRKDTRWGCVSNAEDGFMEGINEAQFQEKYSMN